MGFQFIENEFTKSISPNKMLGCLGITFTCIVCLLPLLLLLLLVLPRPSPPLIKICFIIYPFLSLHPPKPPQSIFFLPLHKFIILETMTPRPEMKSDGATRIQLVFLFFLSKMILKQLQIQLYWSINHCTLSYIMVVTCETKLVQP